MKTAYRASANISLDALEYNINQIKSKLRPDTRLMCVIKADAYGHGAVVFAQELLKMGADSFAVATVDEGIELRRNGIEAPILILGPVHSAQYPDIIVNHLMPSVFTFAMAKDIDNAAAALDMKADIHIKLDTGMSRIGFRVNEESIKSITMISSLLKNVNIDGIFTHFACADCADDAMTAKQAERFRWAVDELGRRGVHIPCVHCSNSAAIMRYPQLNMNMVRAGIIIYGLYPSGEVDKSLLDLKPVMSLTSRVAYIKDVEPGTSVGYGASFVCQRPTRIATVSIGYADGYPRAMSNKGMVIIRNKRYPIIGRVCMDQLMVDITDAGDEVRQCDCVTLVGSQGTESIPVEEVADESASFNYEFVCGISRRVPRIYYRGGKPVRVVNYLAE